MIRRIRFINSPKRVLILIADSHNTRFIFSPKRVNTGIGVIEAEIFDRLTIDGTYATIDGTGATIR